MQRSDLPFGSEFSSAQIDLPVVLALAHRYGTDWSSFEDTLRDRYFADHKTSDDNKGKLANNTKLSWPHRRQGRHAHRGGQDAS